MRIYTRTFWSIVLGIALLGVSASAQGRKWQFAPPQNGGPAARHQVERGVQKLDPKQSGSGYTWLELDPSGQGVGYCYADAHALNNADQVVINWSDPSDCNIWHASLWDKGKWLPLDYTCSPSCTEPASYLTGITHSGFAFGTYWSMCPDGPYEPAGGVNVKSRQWSLLPNILGYPLNQGFSLSDNGVAVGVASNPDSTAFQHWIWDGSAYTFLTFPDDWDVNTWWAGPLFINNRGQIVGQYYDTKLKYERGYLQEGSTITILDLPGNPDGGTYVNGINNEGYALLAGSYDAGSPYYPSASFVYKQGNFTQLPAPPFNDMTLWFIFNVTDHGDMIGRWWDSNNQIHTFIAFRN